MRAEAVLIRVNSLRLEVGYGENDLFEAVCRRLKTSEEDIISLEPVRISLDARKKNDIHYVCSADVSVKNESAVLSNRRIKIPLRKLLFTKACIIMTVP